MQLLANGRDQVAQSYAEGPLTLHRLVDGTFQFGVGKDASVVSTIEQVKRFDEGVQAQVDRWLKSGGYERGMEAKRTLDLADSSQAMPGSLEAAIMAKGGAALLGQIHALITGSKNQSVPPSAVPPDVLRPDPKVPVVLADEEDEDASYDLMTGDLVCTAKPEGEHGDAPTAQAPQPISPAPANQLQQDILASLAAMSEAIGHVVQRMEKIEQRPTTAPKKRVRPSRAKKPATKPATT